MSILQKIKSGKKNYKLIDFPGTTEKVAMVILSSNQMVEIKLRADDYIESKKIKDEDYADSVHQMHIMYEALRNKDNVEEKLSSSFDEFKELVDNNELTYLMVQYNMMMQENSPLLNSLTDEQFEALKKTLEKTTLKDLNGESLLALRNFLISLRSKN